MAKQDAVALYCFLLNRGYILPEPAGGALPVLPSPLPALIRDATPLTGVDMIKVRVYVCMCVCTVVFILVYMVYQ